MATNTRGARANIHQNLLRKTEHFVPNTDVGKNLVSVAKSVLDMNPLDAEETAEEIGCLMRSLLPAPVEVLNEKLLRAPSFPLVLLQKVADRYSCLRIPIEISDRLDEDKRRNSILMTYIWFACALSCEWEAVNEMITVFRKVRVLATFSLPYL